MKKVGSLDRVSMISVLSEGRELANELKRKLQPTSTIASCDSLLENILSSYENAIKLLHSNHGSPMISEASVITSKDNNHISKKRKALMKCSEQVRVRSETGFEGQLNDGYCWRKYGQKDILGANHPRAYYRCTHRNTQGCVATKQVQRADQDPSVFEVIYRGKHSCVQEILKENMENDPVFQKKEDVEESPIESQQMVTIATKTSLKTENQELVGREEGHFSSFLFPSTPIESENSEATFFPDTNDFTAMNYSPPFLSPVTPESYFSMSECLVNDFGNDATEIISNPSPLPSFSYGDLDIMIDQIDFSSQFLDDINYF